MRFSIVSISFFVVVLFLTHAISFSQQCPSPVPEQYASVKPGKIVAAYFASWDKYGNYKVADIDPIAYKLTHIIYAFAKPESQSSQAMLPDPWADVGANFEHRKKVGGHFGQLLQLKQKYPHLKVLLSVGGGLANKQFIDIAQSGQVKQFVSSAIKLLDQFTYNFEHTGSGADVIHTFEYQGLFDGIDLDWEWSSSTISPEHVALYHNMVKVFAHQLAQRLTTKGKKSMLTCAVQVNPKIIECLQLGSLSKYVSWFNLMAYDFGGASAQGVSMNAPICNQWSSLSIDGSVSLLLNLGVSPHKIVLGIPLYGHVFDKTQPKLGSAFEKTSKTGSLRYEQIKELYVRNPACQTKWHIKSHVPYAYCPTDSIFVSYDDERSVKAKASYAKFKKLRGLVFWRLSGDDKDHSLVRAIG